MKRLSLLILTIFLLHAANQSFAAVDACISVPATYTITAKTVKICKNDWIDITAANCLANTVAADENYFWINLDNGTLPTYTSKTISTPDTGRWEVTLTTPLGTDKDTLYVQYYPQPTFRINGFDTPPPVAKCPQDIITLTATSNPSFSNYNWYVSGNPASLGTGTSLSVQDVPGGSQFYEATTYYSVTGCTLKNSVFVYYSKAAAPIFLGNDTTLCVGQSLDLVITNVLILPDSIGTNGSAYQVRWNGAGAFVYNDTIRSNITTSGTYYADVKGPNGSPYFSSCPTSDTIKITFKPVPVVEAGADNAMCNGNNILFSDASVSGSATAPLTYSWTPTAGLSNSNILSPTASPTTTTTYTLLVTSADNCSASDTRTVTINPVPIVSLPFADTTICKGDSISLNTSVAGGTVPYSYSWTPTTGLSNITAASPKASPSSPANYRVIVTDQKSCKDTAFVNVDILWVNLISNALGLNGDSIKVGAHNDTHSGFAYRWKDGVGNVIGTDSLIWVKTSGKYFVEVYNTVTNCFVTDSINVTFAAEIIQDIYVPNAFNPTMSEADNAHLRVYGNNVSNNTFLFRVYNKWGELVYETQNFDEANQAGWDGSLNNSGTPLNTGVYTYTVSGEFLDGTTFQKTGTASLLR